jgi:hypothetical protein
MNEFGFQYGSGFSSDQQLVIRAIFAQFDNAMNTLQIDSQTAGNITSISQDGTSGVITVRKNAIIVTAPFTLSIGDLVDIERSIFTTAGFVNLNGSYV